MQQASSCVSAEQHIENRSRRLATTTARMQPGEEVILEVGTKTKKAVSKRKWRDVVKERARRTDAKKAKKEEEID